MSIIVESNLENCHGDSVASCSFLSGVPNNILMKQQNGEPYRLVFNVESMFPIGVVVYFLIGNAVLKGFVTRSIIL